MSESIITECAYSTEVAPFKKHFHMSYELIYVKKGNSNIKINDITYNVSDNMLVLINCFEEHSVDILTDNYERYYVNFARKKIDKLLNNPQLVGMLRNRPIGFKHCAVSPENADYIFKSFLLEYQKNDNLSDEMILCQLKELLIETLRINQDNFPNKPQNVKPEIFEIQAYIDKHFAEEIEITALAEKFFINKYYLSHSFKDAIGYSPKQYLLLNRLAFAKMLLCDSDLNISEVGVKSGFYDANNFIRTFKSETGITPYKYRISLKK